MKWLIPKHDGIPLLEWLYSQRNIQDQKKYFQPTFEDMPDPFLLHDMDKAVDFIIDSVKKNKKIYIHGDFDADGITATSIMWLFLSRHLKADILPYIPSRFYEGYGLTDESVGSIIEKGGEVIITVDCGVKDIELVNKYATKVDFVITDHHTIRSIEPDIQASKVVSNYLISSKAKAVVHPALYETSFKEICGAMVSYKVCCAINKKLNLDVDMLQFADLCAIGTVCDVMPLIEENRTIVQLGLQQITKQTNIGLKALLDQARVKDGKVSAYHIGFVIGPRLNAAGRLGDALDAVRLLTTSSNTFARQMAQKLEDLNLERKRLTEQFMILAEKELSFSPDNKIFAFFGDEWPEGLLGLIAGKLSEKYNIPVVIGSKGKVFKASARSPEGFNITEYLSKFEEYLEKFGGHAQAAGLTVKSEFLETFLEKFIGDVNSFSGGISERLLQIDGIAKDISDLSIENAEKLLMLEPFGSKNPKPVIYIDNLRVKRHSFMGQNNEHIKLYFYDSNENVIEALSFGDSKRFFDLVNSPTLPVQLAVNLEVDEWNGFKKPSLRIVDFKVN